MTDEILTLKEVAEYLKLTEKTAYRLATEGKLPGFKVGGSLAVKTFFGPPPFRRHCYSLN